MSKKSLYVIQADTEDGAYLFWSNDAGWVDLDSADVFSSYEKRQLNLPMADDDAAAVLWIRVPDRSTSDDD